MSEYKVTECEECFCDCRKGRDCCVKPPCGSPDKLSVFSPVIYDEIGINLCRTITLPANVLTDHPTTKYVQLLVAYIKLDHDGAASYTDEPHTYTEEEKGEMGDPVVRTTVSTIPGRSNCLKVKLTNIKVTFWVKLFDNCKKYLATVPLESLYLPGVASGGYNEKTNPHSVTFDMYAPFGASVCHNHPEKFYVNFVGFCNDMNTVVNGINMSAVTKVMDFDPTTGEMSAGLTLFVRTVYYEAYKFASEGKTVSPKISTITGDENPCLEFVEGGLIYQNIKPLELSPPKCEGKCKREPVEHNELNPCTKIEIDPCEGIERIDS